MLSECKPLTVGLVGCGRMGQSYAEVLHALPDTQLVAIAESNPERLQAVGARFGIDSLFCTAAELFDRLTPDIAVIVLPGKYIQDAVLAAVAAGVRGVATEKPIGAVLSDVDVMIEACAEANIIFAGGSLQRAMAEVQQAAARLHSGEFGTPIGACVHRFGGEISGGGCQHIAVLRLLTGAEVTEVTAWGEPEEALQAESDEGLNINGQFRLSNGMLCPVFSGATPNTGVDVWTENALIRWDWGPPQIFLGVDDRGNRLPINPEYTPATFPEFGYTGTSLLSFVDVVRRGIEHENELAISARDLRASLEVAIACRQSARLGNIAVSVPLADRSLHLYPRAYRWLGGDQSGLPQSLNEAGGKGT